jgi:hypothetical protein
MIGYTLKGVMLTQASLALTELLLYVLKPPDEPVP